MKGEDRRGEDKRERCMMRKENDAWARRYQKLLYKEKSCHHSVSLALWRYVVEEDWKMRE